MILHTVYSVQCTILVYCILVLSSVLALFFVNLHDTIVYYSTRVCCNVLFLYMLFYNLLWYSIFFLKLTTLIIYFFLFTQHNSTSHEFHILSRKGGKNGECLHNTFLLHMNFIFCHVFASEFKGRLGALHYDHIEDLPLLFLLTEEKQGKEIFFALNL